VPGRYRLFAERTGFLEVEETSSTSEGRILDFNGGAGSDWPAGALAASAVVVGRVTGRRWRSVPNAQVAVLGRGLFRGNSRFEQQDRCGAPNDLGDIASLIRGRSYFVSVSPPPNLRID